ncbi:MAG: type IV pilus assembly protein PilM [Actinomycetota bacterium]|nr:type IV pilus assembly protein PilM [Actinomycetota bacterium]
MPPLIGLDVGTTAVRAAEISQGKDGTSLVRFSQVGLPPSAAPDGEVADVGLVTASIKEAIERGGFRTRRVGVGVSNQKVVVRQVDLPWMEEAELRSSIQFQVQEFIPIPVDDAILDFQVLEEFAAEGGERRMQVLLVAAQRGMIDALVQAVQNAGLDPALVDVSPFAALRAVSPEHPPLLAGRESEALIDIGGGVTNIVLHEQGSPKFVRILPMGGADITEALVAGLGIPVEDAESVKSRVGVAAEAGGPVAEGAATIIETRAASFIEEVRGSIDYYLGQPNAAQITRVSLTGGGARLPNLRARIEAALHLPVVEADPTIRVRPGKGFEPELLAQISAVGAVAIGLTLGGN